MKFKTSASGFESSLHWPDTAFCCPCHLSCSSQCSGVPQSCLQLPSGLPFPQLLHSWPWGDWPPLEAQFRQCLHQET